MARSSFVTGRIRVHVLIILTILIRKNQPEKKLAVKVMKKAMMVQKNMVDQVILLDRDS